jgi:hypothetical protein
MEDRFKRPNKANGKPYEPGFQDEDGRVFYATSTNMVMTVTILKNGKKDMKSYVNKRVY